VTKYSTSFLFASIGVIGVLLVLAPFAFWQQEQSGETVGQTPRVDKGDTAPLCLISAPKGPWDYYQMRDLPRGDCSGAQACTIWTKDSCPGTDFPGPAIQWKCVCDSGTWQCDEQERTKTACVTR
jgi:hypothetical protein